MEKPSVLNLPVERNEAVAYQVSRHDLLGAWIGFGLGSQSPHKGRERSVA